MKICGRSNETNERTRKINPYEGDSVTTLQPGLTGINRAAVAGPGLAAGVLGASEIGEGVHGKTNSTQFAAVAGIETNPSSNIAAVYGEQRGNGPGVYGIAKGNGAGVFGTSTSGLAGQFQGDVQITGRLTVQGKDFEDKIATIKKILIEWTGLVERFGPIPSTNQLIQSL